MIYLKTKVRAYLLIMKSVPSWRITPSWTMSIIRMTSPGGSYGLAGDIISNFRIILDCSLLISHRVEDLAAAVPTVPDLPPMNLLQ